MISRKNFLNIVRIAVILNAWALPSQAMLIYKTRGNSLGRYCYSGKIKLSPERKIEFNNWLIRRGSAERILISPSAAPIAVPCGNFAKTQGAIKLCAWPLKGQYAVAIHSKEGEAVLINCDKEGDLCPILTLIDRLKKKGDISIHLVFGDKSTTDTLFELVELIDKDLVKTYSPAPLVIDANGDISCHIGSAYYNLDTSLSEPLISLSEIKDRI